MVAPLQLFLLYLYPPGDKVLCEALYKSLWDFVFKFYIATYVSYIM